MINSDFDFLADDWEWEDESGTWNSYSASLGRLFEAASVSGLQSVQFTAAGRQYLFHPKLMEQENIETGVKRNVRKHDPEKFKGKFKCIDTIIIAVLYY